MLGTKREAAISEHFPHLVIGFSRFLSLKNYKFTTAKKPKPIRYGNGSQTVARGPSTVH